MSGTPGLTSRRQASFNALRGLVGERAPQERCDICGAGLRPYHAHLLEPVSRQIVCACDPCAVSEGNRQGTRYRRIPQDVRVLSEFQMPDALWDSLLIPVGMAFFFHSTPAGKVVVFYPGPAGATESQLDLTTWAGVTAANPVLEKMQPDVEALLVNRVGRARDYYLAPIDKCYELVGLIRVYWRGLSGGSQVWEEINAFFGRLQKLGGTESNRLRENEPGDRTAEHERA